MPSQTVNHETLKAIRDFSLECWDLLEGQTFSADEDWWASLFFRKNTISTCTIVNLTAPFIIVDAPAENTEKTFNPLDFSSANAIIRAMFESYANMHYLVKDNVDKIEKEFRFLSWERHSYTQLLKMNESSGFRAEDIPSIKQEISDLESKMLQQTYFMNLGDSQKSFILDKKDNWAFHNISDRARRAGIHDSQVTYLYSILSNYSHSTAFSMKMIGLMEEEADVHEQIQLPIIYAEMFQCLTLNIFANLIPDIKDKIDSNQDIKSKIILWEEHKQKDLKEICQSFATS